MPIDIFMYITKIVMSEMVLTVDVVLARLIILGIDSKTFISSVTYNLELIFFLLVCALLYLIKRIGYELV